ncbi:membrane protein [Pseudoclavibacter endophyticus]|uniref:Phage holin family protein n=1 Tax=Pseudoclavibacter endophyticus TaxID=1778590 RepID=A0A6H9WR99_9MICO|nr:phage holin family protein [Pseudoclavibacter endophyticus]KAB1648860.1 phage holin family protein [Pseudoclavibacter endophyticus]GGA67779.1 membrane protein [Pseudoclavibacter endophyticus]
MRFLLSIVVNAVALWLTTLILGGVRVEPYADTVVALVVTYVLLGVIWGVVNATIGSLIRLVGFCFYVITLGLIALVVNGFLFWIVAWVSELMGFGLAVDNFWWAIGAAIVMSILTAILGGIAKRLTDRRSSADRSSKER